MSRLVGLVALTRMKRNRIGSGLLAIGMVTVACGGKEVSVLESRDTPDARGGSGGAPSMGQGGSAGAGGTPSCGSAVVSWVTKVSETDFNLPVAADHAGNVYALLPVPASAVSDFLGTCSPRNTDATAGASLVRFAGDGTCDWSTRVGGADDGSDGSLAVGEGWVVTTGTRQISAFDSSGSPLWKLAYGGLVQERLRVVGNETVFFAQCDGTASLLAGVEFPCGRQSVVAWVDASGSVTEHIVLDFEIDDLVALPDHALTLAGTSYLGEIPSLSLRPSWQGMASGAFIWAASLDSAHAVSFSDIVWDTTDPESADRLPGVGTVRRLLTADDGTIWLISNVAHGADGVAAEVARRPPSGRFATTEYRDSYAYDADLGPAGPIVVGDGFLPARSAPDGTAVGDGGHDFLAPDLVCSSVATFDTADAALGWRFQGTVAALGRELFVSGTFSSRSQLDPPCSPTTIDIGGHTLSTDCRSSFVAHFSYAATP